MSFSAQWTQLVLMHGYGVDRSAQRQGFGNDDAWRLIHSTAASSAVS